MTLFSISIFNISLLVTESNERLQSHLKERMNSIEEKNCLTQDLEKTRKIIEELQHEKVEYRSNKANFYYNNEQLKNKYDYKLKYVIKVLVFNIWEYFNPKINF